MTGAIAALLVRVTDLERSERFYTSVLGLQFRATDAGIRTARLGELTVVLQQHDRPGMTPTIAFAVDDMAAVVAAARQEGQPAGGGSYRLAGAEGARLTDPDGLPVEVVARQTLPG